MIENPNIDDPPGSRVFVVCGKQIEEDQLGEVFQKYGQVQHIRLVKEKGVAYVKYDRASSGAHAIEKLHGTVLNNGLGPSIKVLLAEPPKSSRSKNATPSIATHQCDALAAQDPDNIPARSRLFLVVPKTADPEKLESELFLFPGLEYCKHDLIATKGVAFCKYNLASTALTVMETIQEKGTLGGYRVKCMLAEPKMRNRLQVLSPSFGDDRGAELGLSASPTMVTSLFGNWPVQQLLGQQQQQQQLQDLAQQQQQQQQQQQHQQQQQIGALSQQLSQGLSALTQPSSDQSITKRQRLFVVVHKGVTVDQLRALFRQVPGMEYCDLKTDRVTGKSKGFCYVNYSTVASAEVALNSYQGLEFPPASGYRLKVMYAEPLSSPTDAPPTQSPSTLGPPSCASPENRGMSPIAGQSPPPTLNSVLESAAWSTLLNSDFRSLSLPDLNSAYFGAAGAQGQSPPSNSVFGGSPLGGSPPTSLFNGAGVQSNFGGSPVVGCSPPNFMSGGLGIDSLQQILGGLEGGGIGGLSQAMQQLQYGQNLATSVSQGSLLSQLQGGQVDALVQQIMLQRGSSGGSGGWWGGEEELGGVRGDSSLLPVSMTQNI